MELIKDKKPQLFEEYEEIIINAINKRMERSKSLDRFIDVYIESFRTIEERKQIKEFTFQIESVINLISRRKENMLKEIDLSYTYSSHLIALTTARAKFYCKAIERIEEYYEDNKISDFLKYYKNL